MFKTWKPISILIALALVLALGIVTAPMAGTVEAATIRVPDDYESIQDAINNASAGDTIIVAPGTYYENLEIPGYEWNLDGLTIRSSHGAAVTTIDGMVFAGATALSLSGATVVAIYDADGVTFQGFTVTKSSVSTKATAPLLSGYGIEIYDTSNCLIANNIITNHMTGISVKGSSLMTADPLPHPPPPDEFNSYGNSITDNVIRDNGEGIGIYGAGNTQILRNDIINNTAATDTGIDVSWSNGTEVHFNNIEGNSEEGDPSSLTSVASYGVYNTGSNPMLDATFNWWGDASGPYDPNGDTEVCPCTDDPETEKNADGQGDTVSDNVDYCPWLLERYPPGDSVSTTTGKGEATFSWNNPDTMILQLLETEGVVCSPRADMFFPFGTFSFKVLVKNPGDTVVITMTLPRNMPMGTQYWKCQNGEWVDVTSLLGDNDGDNVLTLSLTDGGLGDADGEANGVIVDPGGPVIPLPVSTKKAPEPARFSTSYMRVSPTQVNPNQPVTVSINVANTGEESGGHSVNLYVNGRVEQSKTVSASPGSTQSVLFTVTKGTPGTYNVMVEGQNGQFIVASTSLFSGGLGGGLDSGGMIVIVLVLIALIAAVAFIMRSTRGAA